MPIRILHVIETLSRGGAERQLVDVAVNTDRAEFENIVCYFRAPDAFAADLRQVGLEVICLELPGRRSWLTAAARLRRLIKARQPHVVHAWLTDASISARLARLTTRSPRIITSLCNPDYEAETINAANWPPLKMHAVRLIDRLTARITRDLFVAVSQFVAQSTSKYLAVPQTDMRMIHNSVDAQTLDCTPDAPRQLRQELAIPPDAFVFVTVGRLDPQKGQANLLRAFQQVTAAIPDAYLALVGVGPLAPVLRQLAAELGVEARVKFLGRRDRMIKKRGYRIELGEIEAALYRHPAIKEAAVLAFPDEENVPIKAFASTRNGTKLSIIELKKFCSENLPLYMVPDLFCCLEALPKTSTDKIDYQTLKAMR